LGNIYGMFKLHLKQYYNLQNLIVLDYFAHNRIIFFTAGLYSYPKENIKKTSKKEH